MTSHRFFLGALAALALTAAPAFADEPGPGGSKPPVAKTGEEVYRTYCQACHMADAKGAVGAGAFPALASNPRLGTTGYAAYIVANGKGGMPWFKDALSKAQAQALLTYLRTHFGNDYKEPVTAADVEAFGQTPTSRF
ncbi:MAG: cytochrome c [Phenylobacterium sp.]|uniref:c-type cytochrome n=1 Tax=Phenylobacterium sp. TaxID=1871053 RepID=UPI00121D5549|nr:cytochrome c [Phenylobacterium sp.]TAJ68601.1 MAG: cytochrome c [Phenylobacterium sp.]